MGRAGTGEGDGARQIWRRRCGAPAVGGAGDGARRPLEVQEKVVRRPAEAEEMGRGGRPNWRRRLRVSQPRRRRWGAPAAPYGGGDGCAKAAGSGGDVVAAAVGGDGGAAAVEGMEARRLWRG